jgi:hypothetical protein
MSREERMELMTAVVAKLEEVAQLLIKAEEAVFADRVEELADLIYVVATIGEDAKDAAAVQKSPLAD